MLRMLTLPRLGALIIIIVLLAGLTAAAAPVAIAPTLN
jgi:hypothetical protein